MPQVRILHLVYQNCPRIYIWYYTESSKKCSRTCSFNFQQLVTKGWGLPSSLVNVNHNYIVVQMYPALQLMQAKVLPMNFRRWMISWPQTPPKLHPLKICIYLCIFVLVFLKIVFVYVCLCIYLYICNMYVCMYIM